MALIHNKDWLKLACLLGCLVALIRNKDWLKLAVLEGAGKDGKAEKLRRVGKSENLNYKARKKLIAGENALKGWEGGYSVVHNCGTVVCVRSKGS